MLIYVSLHFEKIIYDFNILSFQCINMLQNSGRLNHWINRLFIKKMLPFLLLRHKNYTDCFKRLTFSTRVAPYLFYSRKSGPLTPLIVRKS